MTMRIGAPPPLRVHQSKISQLAPKVPAAPQLAAAQKAMKEMQAAPASYFGIDYGIDYDAIGPKLYGVPMSDAEFMRELKSAAESLSSKIVPPIPVKPATPTCCTSGCKEKPSMRWIKGNTRAEPICDTHYRVIEANLAELVQGSDNSKRYAQAQFAQKWEGRKFILPPAFDAMRAIHRLR